MNLKIWLLFLTSLVLCSCTSLIEKADKQFEQGSYHEAEALYEQAVHKNPSSAEAAEGLRKSRQKVLEQDLIEVRQLRMSDDDQTALDRLALIYKQEAAWNIAPSGPAFATQEEESDELFSWFKKQVRADLSSGQFLKAKLSLEKYKIVFSAGARASRLLALEQSIRTKGELHCAQLQKTAAGPFSAEFVRRYCMAWGGADAPAFKRKPAWKDALPHYGDVELSVHVANLSPEAVASLNDSLRTALKSSAYYLAGATPLKVGVVGQFTSVYREVPILSVQNYEVDVPYQVEVTVPYQQTYQVPYTENQTVTTVETRYDPVVGAVTQVPVTSQRPVTNFREETRTVYRQEWQTRSRKEPRSFTYPAMQFSLDYLLSAQVEFAIDGVKSTIPVQDEMHVNDDYHSAENSQIGLKAKPKSAPTEFAWLKPKLDSAGQKMILDLYAVWDSKYCQTPDGLSESVQIESVMKCLRGTNANHEFVENWFNSRFGLSYATVSEALGVVR